MISEPWLKASNAYEMLRFLCCHWNFGKESEARTVRRKQIRFFLALVYERWLVSLAIDEETRREAREFLKWLGYGETNIYTVPDFSEKCRKIEDRHVLWMAVCSNVENTARVIFDEFMDGRRLYKEFFVGVKKEDDASRLRDVIHDPYMFLVGFPLADLRWLSKDVCNMVQAIDASGNYGDLPVLADALEEAGCENVDFLEHLRGPCPHIKGCWAIESLKMNMGGG